MSERHLEGQDANTFLKRAAHYMGEINAVHPFRDGNGRAQREFIRQLGAARGYALDWSRVSRAQMTEASKRSFQAGDNVGLEDVLRRAMDSWPKDRFE